MSTLSFNNTCSSVLTLEITNLVDAEQVSTLNLRQLDTEDNIIYHYAERSPLRLILTTTNMPPIGTTLELFELYASLQRASLLWAETIYAGCGKIEFTRQGDTIQTFETFAYDPPGTDLEKKQILKDCPELGDVLDD